MQNAKQQAKTLWLRSFDDSREFVDYYFEKYFSVQNNVFVERNGKIVSALQALPFPLKIEYKTAPSVYLSGICTDKNFQRQGFMRQLLTKTFRALFDNQYWAATLIPASENLEKTYQKFGFATLQSPQITQINTDKNIKNNMCKPIKSVSSVCNTPLFNQLEKIYGELIETEFPYGMLRIINVEKLLKFFAEINPENELNLNVFDEILPENCGNFQLKNGFVIHNNEFNKKNSTFEVKDLAEIIFKI